MKTDRCLDGAKMAGALVDSYCETTKVLGVRDYRRLLAVTVDASISRGGQWDRLAVCIESNEMVPTVKRLYSSEQGAKSQWH